MSGETEYYKINRPSRYTSKFCRLCIPVYRYCTIQVPPSYSIVTDRIHRPEVARMYPMSHHTQLWKENFLTSILIRDALKSNYVTLVSIRIRSSFPHSSYFVDFNIIQTFDIAIRQKWWTRRERNIPKWKSGSNLSSFSAQSNSSNNESSIAHKK